MKKSVSEFLGLLLFGYGHITHSYVMNPNTCGAMIASALMTVSWEGAGDSGEAGSVLHIWDGTFSILQGPHVGFVLMIFGGTTQTT